MKQEDTMQLNDTIQTMSFNNVHSDVMCDCLIKTFVDTTNEYTRKLKGGTVTNDDFLSHWERGLHQDKVHCQEICQVKSLSINLLKPQNEAAIVEKYKTTFRINPKIGSFYLKFKMKDQVGVVLSSPNRNDNSHHSLIKCDQFSINNLQIIDIVKLA